MTDEERQHDADEEAEARVKTDAESPAKVESDAAEADTLQPPRDEELAADEKIRQREELLEETAV